MYQKPELAALKVGDTAIIEEHTMHAAYLTPVTITKVWANGVLETKYLDGKAADKFNPDGGVRGPGGRGSTTRRYEHLRLLNDGETIESIIANKVAARDKAAVEASVAAVIKIAKIEEWWINEGKAMWDARVVLPEAFMDEKVNIIRYTKYQETYMPFVIVRLVDYMWNDTTEYELHVGGLTGTRYKNEDGTEYSSISTFSSSTIRGNTLIETLYSLTH